MWFWLITILGTKEFLDADWFVFLKNVSSFPFLHQSPCKELILLPDSKYRHKLYCNYYYNFENFDLPYSMYFYIKKNGDLMNNVFNKTTCKPVFKCEFP